MMELRKLGDLLKDKDVSVNLKEMKDGSSRLYMRVDVQFTIYFIQWDCRPFLKVYIARPYGFDYKGLKQSVLENDRCKKAKLELLKIINSLGIPVGYLEEYGSWEEVKLSPTEGSLKLKLGELI